VPTQTIGWQALPLLFVDSESTSTSCVCRLKREQASAADNSASKLAARDQAKARALQQMMDNTLQKEHDTLEDLQREPWMDIPLQQMSKQQREELQAFGKLGKEHEEQRTNARRALELERKGIDGEFVNSIQAFNATMYKLHDQFLDVCMTQAVNQQQQLDLAALVQGCYDSRCLGQKVNRSTLQLKQHLALLNSALKMARTTADVNYSSFMVCCAGPALHCCSAEQMSTIHIVLHLLLCAFALP
jgi:hypothetical protein